MSSPRVISSWPEVYQGQQVEEKRETEKKKKKKKNFFFHLPFLFLFFFFSFSFLFLFFFFFFSLFLLSIRANSLTPALVRRGDHRGTMLDYHYYLLKAEVCHGRGPAAQHDAEMEEVGADPGPSKHTLATSSKGRPIKKRKTEESGQAAESEGEEDIPVDIDDPDPYKKVESPDSWLHPRVLPQCLHPGPTRPPRRVG
ncbi:hypothetical protein F4780DRAFT_315159 [Xylariomycetidae sp. FL0641]|nr:hypothetical protein F4780DRAFT_315159 [Xylariomycetidae sp. FL0641]